MPAFPQAGEKTVCEVNRELLISKGEGDSSAERQYLRVLGFIYPQLHWNTDGLQHVGIENFPVVEVKGEYIRGEQGGETEALPVKSVAKQTSKLLGAQQWMTRLPFFSEDVKVQTPAGPRLSWHWTKQRLAMVGRHDFVMVYDFENTGSRKEPVDAVLIHEFQTDIAAIEWRPRAGAALAVACRSGVCFWSLTEPSLKIPHSSVVHGGGPPAGAGGDGGGASSSSSSSSRRTSSLLPATMTLFRTEKPVTAMAWSPCGRLLATASRTSATISVWDVAIGERTTLRRGFSGITLLRWSNTADYLISAQSNGEFHIWETSLWRSELWKSGGGQMLAASWSPDGRSILSLFQGARGLAAIYFTGRAPSIDVHILPVELPVVLGTGNREFDMMAWDPSGERLVLHTAVAGGGKETDAEEVLAVYDIRRIPIISASLIGYIRGPAGSKPLALAFHSKFHRGALLAVGWSNGEALVYPMLFHTHYQG